MSSDREQIQQSDVWISGGETVDGEQFIEAIDAVVRIQDALEDLQMDLADMDTGLDREDTIRLIKGRNMGMALGDIEAFFDAVDVIVESEPPEVAPRLISSKVSNMTIEEAAEVFDELVQLAEKYGSLQEDQQ